MSGTHAICRIVLRETTDDMRSQWGIDRVLPLSMNFRPEPAQNCGYAYVTLPNGFEWQGGACCRYDARAKAWDAWVGMRSEEKLHAPGT